MQTKLIDMKARVEGRVVTGLASVFGNVDSYGDVMHPGAFRKTIREGSGRVKHLWMHDYSTPPTAVIRELREVGAEELPGEVREHFPEASGGLVVVREYLETPRAQEILEGIKMGAITEMSFAYDAVKWDVEEREEKSLEEEEKTLKREGREAGEEGREGRILREEKKKVKVRNLREVRLWDTSDVTWGANEATVASKGAEWLERTHIEMAITNLQDALSISDRSRSAERSAWRVGEIHRALKLLNEMMRTAEPGVEIDTALTENVLKRLRSAEIDLRLRGV